MKMDSPKVIDRVNFFLNISDAVGRRCRQPIVGIPGSLSEQTRQSIETMIDPEPTLAMEERYGIKTEGFF